MRVSIALSTLFAAAAIAHPVSQLRSRAPLSPDPAGEKNVGNGAGGQFITGQCLRDADCGSNCCATLGNIGICSGPGASTQQGKTGCGFGGGGGGGNAPPPPVANTTPPPPTPNAGGGGGGGLKPDPAGERHVGNGRGEQFITGQCLSNADCASTCCATLGNIGICSGPGASTQQGKTGCGFNSSGGGAAPPPVANTTPPPPPPVANTNTGGGGGGLKPDPAGERHVGNGRGEQFITGQCLSNNDCQSNCCATLGAIGICSGPGASTQQGKTGCGFNSVGGGAPPPVANTTPPPPPPVANTNTGGGGGGLKPDPAGERHVGNGRGEQFITGQCVSNDDCASACCATLGNIGICSGPGASTQQGKTGCGFNGGAAGAAPAPAAPAPGRGGRGGRGGKNRQD